MKEREFQGWVLDVAVRFHWIVYHVPAPMRATKHGFVGAREAAGLFDLIMFHDDPPRLVLAELKGDGGRLTFEQGAFFERAKNVVAEIRESCLSDRPLGGARDVPVGVYVWRPGMEEQIEIVLRSKVMA